MTMKKMFLAFVLVALFARTGAAQFYSDVTFVGSVRTGSYHAIIGIASAGTNGGYYTNPVTLTNYYRMSGTNGDGRIPLSTNVIVTFTGGTNTNAVILAWTRSPGINRQVIEKSYDLGGTWTNWLTVGPTTTTWLDTGSNTWTTNIFTNAFSLIPAGTYPWLTPTNAWATNATFLRSENGTNLYWGASP